MKLKPTISVLMPAYNVEKYIDESIKSILNQTFKDYELIIINDGSTDRTEEIITSYKDPRIRFFKNKKNQGIATTRNLGLQLARAPFVAHMDSDDVALPERFEKELDLFKKNPNLVLVGSPMIIINEDGKRIGYGSVPEKDSAIRRVMSITDPFVSSSVIYKKKAALALGGYDKSVDTAEDYDLWEKLLDKGQAANTCEPLCLYRLNSKGLSASQPKLQANIGIQIAKRRWDKYGYEGPAPQRKWGEIWPNKSNISFAVPTMYRYYAQLHILFAKKYLQKRRFGQSLEHLLGAIDWAPFSFYPYFYIFMYFMPFKVFNMIEQKIGQKVGGL